MKRVSGVLSSLLVAMTAIALPQTQSEPLVKQTFTESKGDWTTFGPNATLTVSHDSPIVAAGEGALKFGYNVTKGDISALVFPSAIGSIARAKSIKFRVRADANTMIAVMLQEQDGGRYVATCLVPKDAWQPIELSIDDFALAQEKDDPKDPDGKLDMDQVSGMVVTDMAQMFVQNDDKNLQSLFGLKGGGHLLYIDNFRIGADAISTTVKTTGSDTLLDTFTHPQLTWFGLGGTRTEKSSGKPLEGPGVKFDYHVAPGKIALLSRSFAPGLLSGDSSLSMNLASVQATKLVIQIEATDGGKYNTTVELPGGSEPKPINLPFQAFKRADDSQDVSGKLDLSKVKTLLIFDSSGILDQADRDNTLWVNQVVVHK